MGPIRGRYGHSGNRGLNRKATNDYYSLLGVARDATEMEIRSAYGRAAIAVDDPPDSARRALLAQGLLVLTDPQLKASYDATLERAGTTVSATTQGLDAFSYALRGGLWFAGGCLVTAVTYASAGDAGGKFFIAWGAVLFGGIQLLRGLAAYLQSGAARAPAQILTLAGLVVVGLVSGGWVVAQQQGAATNAPTLTAWNAAIDATDELTKQADLLIGQVAARTDWTSQDAVDLGQVSALYAQAADVMAKAPALSGHEWYRDGMVADFREAATLATAMSALNASSTQSQWDNLFARWKALTVDYDRLGARFEAERKK